MFKIKKKIKNILCSLCFMFVKEEYISNSYRGKVFVCISCKFQYNLSNKEVGVLFSYSILDSCDNVQCESVNICWLMFVFVNQWYLYKVFEILE